MKQNEITTGTSPVKVELLAPARNAEIAIAAIEHGADAVYMGASSHGARQQASNSLDDVRQVVDYAHRFNAKVYVTVNTIVYDDELAGVERLIWDLYAVGVDAIIVQDLGILSMNLPPIALHASTQCDIRTPAKARFLQDAGFSQLVLPRELSLEEIRSFRKEVSVPLEAFVHGALCVSYSGDCQASFLATGRSANRGECAQICRYRFDLEDASGKKIVEGKYLLSLKDMNRVGMLSEMLDAGISSFKIEGRLKDASYVKNVVGAYSMALDRVIALNHGKYRRASRGKTSYSFTPDLVKTFNRGYTSYFLDGIRPKPHALSSMDSPKWTGEKVGVVRRVLSARSLSADIEKPLANGDGLGFFDAHGVYCGFRLNRVEGKILFSASDIAPAGGTVLYRNADKVWNDRMEKKSARRIIPVEMTLSAPGEDMIALEISDMEGTAVTGTMNFTPQEARTPQVAARAGVLGKLGDTEFVLEGLADELGDVFIPASVLTSLRRETVELLRQAYKACYAYDRRRAAAPDLHLPEGYRITRHDNISNRLSDDFYRKLRDSGTAQNEKALEVSASGGEKVDMRVMQTRYCIRRELGACLKTSAAGRLPSPMFITSGRLRFRIDCDCANCLMNVVMVRKEQS